MLTYNIEMGSIIYSDSAIASIVGINAMEVPGVVGMASKSPTDGIWELLGKENFTRGIKISTENNELSIEISVIVCFGTRIAEVAKNILSKVEYSIETLTDIKIKNITVIIEGVKAKDK